MKKINLTGIIITSLLILGGSLNAQDSTTSDIQKAGGQINKFMKTSPIGGGPTEEQEQPKPLTNFIYRDGRGNIILRFAYLDGEPLLKNSYWGTNGTLYQLYERGSAMGSSWTKESGDVYEGDVTFMDTLLKSEKGTYMVKDGILTLQCDDKTEAYQPVSPKEKKEIEKSISARTVQIVPLPSVRRTEYLFKLKGSETYLYVDADKFNYSYESFHLFILNPEKHDKQEVKIKDVERFRDGGTTIITTIDGGTLFSPISLSFNGEKPYWQPREGEKIEIERELRPSEAQLKQLGVDVSEFKFKSLHTPCNP